MFASRSLHDAAVEHVFRLSGIIKAALDDCTLCLDDGSSKASAKLAFQSTSNGLSTTAASHPPARPGNGSVRRPRCTACAPNNGVHSIRMKEDFTQCCAGLTEERSDHTIKDLTCHYNQMAMCHFDKRWRALFSFTKEVSGKLA